MNWQTNIPAKYYVPAFIFGALFINALFHTRAPAKAPVPEYNKPMAQATPRGHCDDLYDQWDRVYKLHNNYGDNAATAADVAFAKGIWRDCILH